MTALGLEPQRSTASTPSSVDGPYGAPDRVIGLDRISHAMGEARCGDDDAPRFGGAPACDERDQGWPNEMIELPIARTL